jgi:hypothetical protein
MLLNVTDTETKRFWTEEFAGYTRAFRAEASSAILNKAGQFAASPHLRQSWDNFHHGSIYHLR